MENVPIASVAWVLVGALNLALAFAVQNRKNKNSLLFTSPVLLSATACVLVWFVLVFSVYTWGFVDAFVFGVLKRLLELEDLNGWTLVTDQLCAILVFTGVQALCVAIVGMYVALEEDLNTALPFHAWPGLLHTVTAALCVAIAVFALCGILSCVFVVYLVDSLHERPSGIPWDAALVAVQSVLFVMSCVLLCGTRVRARVETPRTTSA